MKTLAHDFLDIERECGFEISQKAYDTLDSVLEKARKKIKLCDNPRKNFENIGIYLNKHFSLNGSKLLHTSMQTKEIDCRGYSALFYAVCEKIGLEDEISCALGPSHVFVVWNDGNVRFNWETTDNCEFTEQDYISSLDIHPDSIANKVYLTELTREQAKSVAYDTCGVIKLEQGDADTSIVCFDKAIELHPKHVRAHCYRGNAKRKKGDYSGSVDDLDKSIELDPNYHRPYHYRGRVRIEQKRFAEAVNDLTKSFELDPKDYRAYYYLAEAKIEIGDHKGAKQDLAMYEKFRK
ncbi:tetratricopeptide repeat protein [Candidatus Woesearchaeota archaeon]|nr:tetratricopeptide repeat protein [Candidatus Woesearchaeota archaeon]